MGKHEKILIKLQQKPIPASIDWRDVESLIKSLGTKCKEGTGSRVTFVLNGVVATFHRPHGSAKTDKGAIKSVLSFLKNTGII